MALDTFAHATTEMLALKIAQIVKEKKVDRLVIGIPFLPGGEEGEQAAHARSASAVIAERTGLPVDFLDERFTTQGTIYGADPDARAACELLSVYVSRNKAIDTM